MTAGYEPASFIAANHTALAAAVAQLRARIERFCDRAAEVEPATPTVTTVSLVDEDGAEVASSLDVLCEQFGLGELERALVVMCLAMETDSRFAELCARAHGKPEMAYPTFCLAMQVLEASDWSVCSPQGTLRAWSILEVAPGKGRVFQPIALGERVLDFLLRNPGFEPMLQGSFRPLPTPARTGEPAGEPASALASSLIRALAHASAAEEPTVVQVCGPELATTRALVQTACAALRCELHVTELDSLPRDPGSLARLLRLWDREAILCQSALLIEYDWASPAHAGAGPSLELVLELLRCPVLLSTRSALTVQSRRSTVITVPRGERELAAASWGTDYLSTGLDATTPPALIFPRLGAGK